MSSGLIVGWQNYGERVIALDRGAFPTEYLTLTDGWYEDPNAVMLEILVQLAATTNFTDVNFVANNWDNPFQWTVDPLAGDATVTPLSLDLADWLGMTYGVGLTIPAVPGSADCPLAPGGQIAFVGASTPPIHRWSYHRSGTADHLGHTGRPIIGEHDEVEFSIWIRESERLQAARVLKRWQQGAQGIWYQDWTIPGYFAWTTPGIYRAFRGSLLTASLNWTDLVADNLSTIKNLRLKLAVEP